MTDKQEPGLVERLREAHDRLNCLVDAGGRRFKTPEERDSECEQASALCWKAADVLASKDAEIAALREALEPFAAVANEYDDAEDDDFEVWRDAGPERAVRASFKLDNYRRARKALETHNG